MLKFFSRLSISIQTFVVFAALMVAVVGAFLVWANEAADRASLNEARGKADDVDNFRAWVAQYDGGIYVKRAAGGRGEIGAFLDEVPVYGPGAMLVASAGHFGERREIPVAANAIATFHQKNPFLAIAELSDITEQSQSRAKFRMASDNYMSDKNAPSLFEMSAIETLRRDGGNEFYTFTGDALLYARPLYASDGCLKCHGSPSNAPVAVRVKYPARGDGVGRGYGYVPGSLVGVTSIRVPRDSVGQMLLKQGGAFWALFAAVIIFIGATYVAIRMGPVHQIKALTNACNTMIAADGALDDVSVPVIAQGASKNEIHQLGQSLGVLHESLNGVLKHFAPSDP